MEALIGTVTEERRMEKHHRRRRRKQRDCSEVDDGSLAAIRQMNKKRSHQVEHRHFRQTRRHVWEIDVSAHIL